MANVLRVLIVLLLVLGLAALVLELKLSGQREELKGRNELLARGIVRLGETIEVAGETNTDLLTRPAERVKVPEEQLKHLYKMNAAGQPEKDAATGRPITQGPGTLEAALTEVIGKSSLELNRLNDTRTALEQNQAKLAQTSDTLKQTEETLTSTKKDLKDREETVAAQKTELEQKKEALAQLQEQKDASDTKAEKQAAEITKLTEQLSESETAIKATKAYVAKLEKQIAQGGGGGGSTNNLPTGIQGEIVAVDTNWNFVVVDVIPDGHVFSMTDLTVQRGNKLVGKIRVSETMPDRNFAIGEVLADWQQTPVAKGDYVFY